ncbi:MAG: 50S ribosomal protein L13 [Phototrophicales bacterium]|nr:MAG: 50S ribosomal protein L13 [Phototrophicales bacterium]
MKFKTFAPTPSDIQREWWIVDAQGETLGRLAARIAHILRGKHKPNYTPNTDMGDYVIVINADKIHVTGRRLDQKVYYRHSGYPGGLKSIKLRELMKKHPERAIQLAVKGMLPHNRLGRAMYKKLKVYAGSEHPHSAQQPKPIKLTK